MRRRRPLPDDRPDWRDPDMPVSIKIGKVHQYVAPDVVQRQAMRNIRFGLNPSWKKDPTYEIRSKA